jgi:hypothetical protein
MKNLSALLLQIAVVLVGLAALTFLLVEPHLEGRNAHASFVQIYFHDPFLAFVYVSSTPFFYGLYRAFGLLRHIRVQGTFSSDSLAALRAIQRCAFALLGFVALGAVFIVLFGDGEDRPAGLFMSLLVASAAGATATTAAILARKLQTALADSTRRPR